MPGVLSGHSERYYRRDEPAFGRGGGNQRCEAETPAGRCWPSSADLNREPRALNRINCKNELAKTLLRHADAGLVCPEKLRSKLPSDVADAYALSLKVRDLRVARGERPLGYKIGFTNRTIWQRYGVFAPIWGTVWDTTVHRSAGSGRGCSWSERTSDRARYRFRLVGNATACADTAATVRVHRVAGARIRAGAVALPSVETLGRRNRGRQRTARSTGNRSPAAGAVSGA